MVFQKDLNPAALQKRASHLPKTLQWLALFVELGSPAIRSPLASSSQSMHCRHQASERVVVLGGSIVCSSRAAGRSPPHGPHHPLCQNNCRRNVRTQEEQQLHSNCQLPAHFLSPFVFCFNWIRDNAPATWSPMEQDNTCHHCHFTT